MSALLLLAFVAQQPQKGDAPKLDPFVAKAIEPADGDSPLRKLQKERVRERALALDALRRQTEIGRVDGNTFADITRLQSTIAENLAEMMDAPADRIKCFEMRLDALRAYEKLTKERVAAGTEPERVMRLATAARIDAEIDLLKLKDAQKKDK